MGDFVLLLPPQFLHPSLEISKAMRLHRMTHWREIEPRAGCRRFLLWREAGCAPATATTQDAPGGPE